MSIWSSMPSYGGKWEVVDERKFTAEEKAAVNFAEVVPSNYGNSVCFHMKGGNMHFIPCDASSISKPGEQINLEEVSLRTLTRDGEEIVRVKC